MPTERRYYDDSYTTRFRAPVARAGTVEGRPAVELVTTYFYPESGGQEADRGTLGPWSVIDVQAGADGAVWHLLEGADSSPAFEPGAEVEGAIDWTRRFDHMQQHTGQHILSAAFERVLGATTVSSHLGEERSSIEIALADTDWTTIGNVEHAANAVVWRDVEIALHWVDDEGALRFELRKPPKFSGRIRIVEIPEWDVSACGGTHTRRTGEVGAIKIVRWEKVRGNLRFEFLCGARALRDHAWRTEDLLEAAKRRTLKDRELIAHLERAASERDDMKKQVRELTEQLMRAEAHERVGHPPRPVFEHRDAWPRDAVRMFAIKCLEAGAPWVVASAGSPEPVVIAARPKSGTLNLKDSVPELLEVTRGKGGGSPDLVQVTAADAVQAKAGSAWMASWMRAHLPG
jgi:alanyl-tRNA synthetase